MFLVFPKCAMTRRLKLFHANISKWMLPVQTMIGAIHIFYKNKIKISNHTTHPIMYFWGAPRIDDFESDDRNRNGKNSIPEIN